MSILHATTNLDLDDTATGYAYRSTEELKSARLLFQLLRYGALVRMGNNIGALALRLKLPIEGVLRNTLGRLFLGGTDLESTLPTLRRLSSHGVSVMLDYAVEASSHASQQEATLEEYLRMIEFSSKHRDLVSFIAIKLTALAPPLLWEKLSSQAPLSPFLLSAKEAFESRFARLVTAAIRSGVPLMVDAEESWIQSAIDRVIEEYMERNNKDSIFIYTTIQMYRRDRLDYLKALLSRASTYKVGVKLVRGAYVEKERKRAKERNYPDPIQPTKAATDIAYDAALMLCLENIERVGLCIATHNRTSCMKAVQYVLMQGISPSHPHLSFSQLYGMADPLSFGLARAGFRVVKYVPYGPVEKAFPYLARRAEENSSLSDQSGRELRWIKEELARRKRISQS
ncbi:MAG: proline dehydrogenase family protein [Bacteroidia bacterium]|nr:proline dehydrogenase family protein [Bacteroidia bacterium]MDW8134112.1 proline dehydrogenase family protein [Bacteroidia bacterium]